MKKILLLTLITANLHAMDFDAFAYEALRLDQADKIESEMMVAMGADFELSAATVAPVVTYNVTIEHCDGVNYHVGYYVDALVATAMDGPDRDLQVIFMNNQAINSSRHVTKNKDHFIHKYNFGRIITYPKMQQVIFD